MTEGQLSLPTPLREAQAGGFDYDDGDGIDFEPYDEFLTLGETTEWWQAWSGNPSTEGAEFRVFGQDGTGGLAAFWLVRPGEPVERQPVVFLGSEGEASVVARDLAAYLWLLADGFGPLEATMWPHHEHRPRPDAHRGAVAERYAPRARETAPEVIKAARAEFPDFGPFVESLCR
ncbi:SMI1/KNR4 family protein [Micromonospora sp. KC606]|uniref:SMI1/KNR4 family protein n=1 Tax=Micromonospora sp. KC606 TaxID=2530379 RepID=UPI0010438EFE|nr:SMI1/KNR4 family protein [Micromonospora sp. KC606]TDC70841.1 SMI1/KNR4 family protein [Micromonospora sp. KC606]